MCGEKAYITLTKSAKLNSYSPADQQGFFISTHPSEPILSEGYYKLQWLLLNLGIHYGLEISQQTINGCCLAHLHNTKILTSSFNDCNLVEIMKPGVVANACYPSKKEAEKGGTRVSGQPELHI